MPGMSTSPPVLLYVEDEPDDVFFMQAALRRVDVATRLKVAEDGERAIAYFMGEESFGDRAEHPLPSVVLLDLNLPVRSGFEVLAWLRERAESRELPVIVFSSSGRPEDRARATELGATDYLLKPASGLGFVAIAEQLCREWLRRAL
jgi:CheY-like chemotaxis protein